MKKSSNFSKAIEDLINGRFPTSNKDGGELVLEAAVADAPIAQKSDEEVQYHPGVASSAESVTRNEGAVRRGVEVKHKEAVITEDMVIKGTINSSANIAIAGTIVGDVISEGDVVVTGKVEGNVTAHALTIREGMINGDILSSGTVVVSENSTIDGNIKAERIEINGKVVGNLESAGKIILNQHSSIEGNVAGIELSMSEGAELKGSVSVRKSE